MFALGYLILHYLKSAFAISQYKIPLLILSFLYSLMILLEIMHKMLRFGSILEIIRVVDMLHAHPIFKGFLYVPLLCLFNNGGAIWIYLNLVHMDSVAQPLLTGHDLGALASWCSSNIILHCIFTCYFGIKHIISHFLHGKKLCLLHHLCPLCFIIYRQINLQ